MLKAAFFTLGCKVNQYETAALQSLFAESGYEIVGVEEKADVYVVNSCTVTSVGDKKSRQALRRMRRQNPEAVISLCGCFPQAFPDLAANIPEADIITGTKDRAKLLGAVEERLRGGGRAVDITPHSAGEKFEELNAAGFQSRTRAFLKIEDGCQQHCAYCIIPAARGPVRSKPLNEIEAEIKRLVRAGYAEIVLTGINLSCYGRDMGLRLIDAAELACGVEGAERVRLSSLEPELLTSSDIEGLARLKNLCPQFHLSLQSGCDATLKRMNRRYTTHEYRQIAENLRAAFKNCAITTDIMVGFPGESDAEFAESMKFCADISFAKAHVFAYSKRPGTLAADMPDQVPEGIKRERSKIMIEATNKTRTAFLQSQLDRPARVLFETRRDNGLWEGYSENYTPVLMETADDLNGKILTVIPTKIKGDFCLV